MTERFYVYILMDGVVPIYVGKGQGDRCRQSQRKHGGEIQIARRFECEFEALAFEKELIAKYKPECNKTAGGEGISHWSPVFAEADRERMCEKGLRRLKSPAMARFWIRCLSPQSRRELMDEYPKAKALFKHFAPELSLEC